MRRFFDLAARACGIEVESRYLYVSRMALYPSLIFSDPDVARELLAHSWDGLSVSAALKRMALSHDRCRPVLDRHGLAEPEEILDAGATERFSRFLGDVWPLVVRGNERRYRRARSYLEQEGVMSAEPAAFVDIGWHGSLQNCLVKLLGHLGVEKKLEGYYLATFQRPPGAAPDFLAEGYLLEKDEPRWLSALVRSSPSLLEILHGADHGGVLGYRRKLRKIVPVLENDREEQRQFKRSIQPLQEAAFELASELLNRHRNAGVRALPPDLVGRIALSLLYQPDAEEARVFGRLKHAADFGGRRRSLTGELEFDLSRLPGIQFQDGTFPLWPAGSRVMKNLSLSRADRAET
jgi:hypothetical protein